MPCSSLLRRFGATLAILLCSSGLLHAADQALQRIEIQDFLAHDWKHELVLRPLHEKIDIAAGEAVHLVDHDGASMPAQIVEEDGALHVAFMTDLPAGKKRSFALMPGAVRSESAARVTEEDDRFLLDNGRIAVAVPRDKKDAMNGPFLGLRLASGAWIGESRISFAGAITAYAVTVENAGPVMATVVCRYVLADDGAWTVTYRLLEGEPVVTVSESGPVSKSMKWSLGFGGPFRSAQYAYRIDIGGPVRSVQQIRPGREAGLQLLPWFHWWNKNAATAVALLPGKPYEYSVEAKAYLPRGMVGPVQPEVFDAEASAEREAHDHVDLIATIGDDGDQADADPKTERRSGYDDGDEALVIAVGRPAEWVGSGPRSPNHGLSLTRNGKGANILHAPFRSPKRRWLLGLTTRKEAVVPFTDLSRQRAMRIKYFETNLNEVLGMRLVWPKSGKKTNPGVVLRPERIAALGKNPEALTRIPQHRRARYAALFDPAKRTPALCDALRKTARESTAGAVEYFLSAKWRGARSAGENQAPHELANMLFEVVFDVDTALGMDLFDADEERLIRSRLAYLVQHGNSPNIVSFEKGLCNFPNMTVSYYTSVGLLALTLGDHPDIADLVAETNRKLRRDLAWLAGPKGGWEEAPHYQSCIMERSLLFGIAARELGFDDVLDEPGLRNAMRFYARISTPPDPRFEGRRHLPPVGNTYLMETTDLYGIGAHAWKDSAPDLAEELQWAWVAQGSPTLAGIGGAAAIDAYSVFLVEPERTVEAAPPWRSEWFPKFGAVFRHGFPGPRESYLLLRQGPWLRHYDNDQGAIILWGKGRPLCEDWGYSGCMPSSRHSCIERAGQSGTVEHFASLDGVDYLRARQNAYARQFCFVKDADPLGPCYLVMQENAGEAEGASPWRLWLSTDHPLAWKEDRLRMTGRDDVDLDIFVPEVWRDQFVWLTAEEAKDQQPVDIPDAAEMPSLAEDDPSMDDDGLPGLEELDLDGMDLDDDGKQKDGFIDTELFSVPGVVRGKPQGGWGMYGRTTQRALRFDLKPGSLLTVLLHPRLRTTAPAGIIPVANGKGFRVTHENGTDIVLLPAKKERIAFDDVVFTGECGVIQIRKGEVRLGLGAGGELAYKDFTIRGEEATEKVFPLLE